MGRRRNGEASVCTVMGDRGEKMWKHGNRELMREEMKGGSGKGCYASEDVFIQDAGLELCSKETGWKVKRKQAIRSPREFRLFNFVY